MQQSNRNNTILIGTALAVLATLVWSGNFIVARGVYKTIPPISLAFYRWLTGTIVIFPFAYTQWQAEKKIAVQHWKYILFTAFMGVTLFNTFVYIAGQYSPAINLALIGTTSSPIMATVLAAVFLKEKISAARIAGMCICLMGILYLLSQGTIEKLMGFHFTKGDWWILLAAFCFAVYNIMVRKKPLGISALHFLFVTFASGTLMLFPAFLVERQHSPAIEWNAAMIGIIAYLGIGTSVVSFLCWNAAIARLGAARTALFGNLLPIFSIIEAMIILKEKINQVHLISGILVITGLLIANYTNHKKKV